MLSIILSACLINNPAHCRDFKIPLDVSMDMRRCSLVAAPHTAQWAAEHPQWQIKRWKCRPTALEET